MKNLATILLLTVFCNSLFYYGYFSFSLLKAKLDAEIALAKTNPQASCDILKVPVRRLQKDETDEVWFDGKLYDVVERDRMNDTLYVFLLRDEQEQNVLAANNRYFQENSGVLPAGGHEVTATKMAVSIVDKEHNTKYQLTFLRQDGPLKPSAAANSSPLSSACTETPYPPPRHA